LPTSNIHGYIQCNVLRRAFPVSLNEISLPVTF
jgi:hypothetical protein